MTTGQLLAIFALLGAGCIGACNKSSLMTGSSSTGTGSGTASAGGAGGAGGAGSSTVGSGGAGVTGSSTVGNGGASVASTSAVASSGTGGAFTSGSGATVSGAGVGGNDGVSVDWQSACWQTWMGHKYQAMEFQYSAPMQLPIEATLFFTTNCDPSNGTDNLNDFNTPTPFGPWIEWFIDHPEEQFTSAIWSFGSHTSGCIDYSNAPDCP